MTDNEKIVRVLKEISDSLKTLCRDVIPKSDCEKCAKRTRECLERLKNK